MKTFDFLVDRLPFGYAFNFDNYLFNKIKHINTQGVDNRVDFFLVNNVKKRIEGKIHFLIKDKVAYSPYKSLFGSFEFNPRVHRNLLSEFWAFIENDLRDRECTAVHITNFAACYSPVKERTITNTLTQHGFEVALKAVNHHIDVTEEPLEKQMHEMQVRRLKKCQNAGFHFVIEPHEHAEAVYAYIQDCRAERGLEISISKDVFQSYLQLFPQNYLMFTLRNGNQMMAATIAIKVQRQILYSFLPANKQVHNNFSPMVMLNVGLYQYCCDHQIELLDLGISTKPSGEDQESLITFKERIGAKKSHKHFFKKDLQ